MKIQIDLKRDYSRLGREAVKGEGGFSKATPYDIDIVYVVDIDSRTPEPPYIINLVKYKYKNSKDYGIHIPISLN